MANRAAEGSRSGDDRLPTFPLTGGEGITSIASYKLRTAGATPLEGDEGGSGSMTTPIRPGQPNRSSRSTAGVSARRRPTSVAGRSPWQLAWFRLNRDKVCDGRLVIVSSSSSSRSFRPVLTAPPSPTRTPCTTTSLHRRGLNPRLGAGLPFARDLAVDDPLWGRAAARPGHLLPGGLRGTGLAHHRDSGHAGVGRLRHCVRRRSPAFFGGATDR